MAWPTSRPVAEEAGPARRTPLSELRARSVTDLPGVGPKIAAALKELGVETLADMISHYPSRHEDLSNVKKVGDLRVGEKATVVGRVVSTRPLGRPVRGRAPGFTAQLYDGTGYLTVTVWGRSWMARGLQPETRVVVSGEVQSRYGIQLVAKSIEVVEDEGRTDEGPHAGRFVPIYPANKGIQARRLRALIHRALDAAGHVLDPLPADLLARHDLPNLHDAVHEVHFPEDRPRLRGAMHRGDGRLLNPFLKGLTFGLTGAQERVIEEVLADMRLEKPMRRLLQGDVGSGKTVVAIAALLTAVEAGGQGAIMAPTEVLAEQHFLSMSAALADL